MLKRRLSEIREKRAEREQEVRLLRGLEQFSESVADALEDPSFETRQQVLRLVVDRIVVEDDKVVVHHVVPTSPVRLQTERLGVTSRKVARPELPRGRFSDSPRSAFPCRPRATRGCARCERVPCSWHTLHGSEEQRAR